MLKCVTSLGLVQNETLSLKWGACNRWSFISVFFLLLLCFPLNWVARKELWHCVAGYLGGSPALSMGWMQTAEGKGLQR